MRRPSGSTSTAGSTSVVLTAASCCPGRCLGWTQVPSTRSPRIGPPTWSPGGAFRRPPILEDLGLAGRKDEVLVLPVGIGEPGWLILLVGNLDSHVELTFGAIARVLTGDLQARELARMEHWQHRLTQLAVVDRSDPDSTLKQLLDDVVREAGAEGGRVGVQDGSGRRRTLAVAGAADVRERPGPDMVAPPGDPRLVDVAVAVTPESSIYLELSGNSPRGPAAAAIAQTWLKTLHVWVAEIAVGRPLDLRYQDVDAESLAFEQRIREEVERAKRFNLGLGLVLIGPEDATMQPQSWGAYDALAAAVRPELRASDLLGRLRVGVAVLLVHSGAEGAESVSARLSARLAAVELEPQGKVRLGRAMFSSDCASADDLIAHARRASRPIPSMH